MTVVTALQYLSLAEWVNRLFVRLRPGRSWCGSR